MSGVFLDERPTDIADQWKPHRAHFVTGPIIPAQGDKVAVGTYLTVFTDTSRGDTYAYSGFVQGRWDWAYEGQYLMPAPNNTEQQYGKWSTQQQIYTPTYIREKRNVNRRRLLMRGSGPALQLYFRDEEDQYFDVIGWALSMTSDAAA